jgi:hypothetical protein
MTNLEIKGTTDTPMVCCDTKGEVTLQGRSLPENPANFYYPILTWISDFAQSKISLIFKMEYLNTSSSKQLYELIKRVKANENIKEIEVKWYYEEGDTDSLETGEHFSSELKLPFEYIEVTEF